MHTLQAAERRLRLADDLREAGYSDHASAAQVGGELPKPASRDDAEIITSIHKHHGLEPRW